MYKSYFRENKDILYYSKKAKLCNILAEGLGYMDLGLKKLNNNSYNMSMDELKVFLLKNKIMSKKLVDQLPDNPSYLEYNDISNILEYWEKKSSILDTIPRIRYLLKEMKKDLYDKKNKSLKGIIPKALHEIRGKYYLYYVIGRYDFHNPVFWFPRYERDYYVKDDRYLIGTDSDNLKNFDLIGKIPKDYVIPVKEITNMKPDNWDSNKTLAKKMISDLKKEFPIFKDLSIPFLVECYNLKYRK